MNTINHTSVTRRHPSSDESVVQPTMDKFRVPHFDSESLPHALQLKIYVPGVTARGIEIALRGTDLFVTARKSQVVRANWKSLHLEAAQHDYGLQLRLGSLLDLSALAAELIDGVLHLTIPTHATSDHVNRSNLILPV